MIRRFTAPSALLFGLGLLAALGRGQSTPDEPPPAPEAPPEAFTEQERAHWSYRPLVRPAVPEVREAGWARNPIDRFILAGVEEMGFRHAPEAARLDYLRRVTFDLTGLPPTPEQVEAFVADDRPDAVERLVDRLLESPAYGERWAQHWLDLAHYADTNGFELDAERPDAWRYRDWVVQALNAGLPYDEFLTLQLAGDEARPGDPQALIATGFGRCGPREVVGGNIDPKVRRQSELTEVTDTVGSVFLGLTMGCARCHNHKFDPLPTTDYYRLQAFFAAAQFVDRPIATEAEEAAYLAAKQTVDAALAPLKARQAELEKPYREALRAAKERALSAAERAVIAVPEAERSPLQKKLAAGVAKALTVAWEEVAEAVARDPEVHAARERLKRQIHDLDQTLPPPPPRAMALADEPDQPAPEVFVRPRGDVRNQGPKVGPRPPGILLAAQPAEAFDPAAIAPVASGTGRRLALAQWLARPDNPVTARVIVNRLWQHHIGRGLVATASDFGVRGESPSHPDLLDWLATELVAGGWRLKPIHRLIVTSATYRQASRFRDPKQEQDDPENLFVWRMNRRRLEAESLRDALLSVTGERLDRMAGPGVRAPIEPEIEALIFTEAEVVDLWPETPDPTQYARRSLYLYRKRNVRYPMFDAFDAPDTQSACSRRGVSTHALQPLILLNGGFAIDRAKALAGRVLREAPETDAQIERAYRLTLGRAPRPDERDQARSFLNDQAGLLRRLQANDQPLARPTGAPESIDPPTAAAWVDLAAALLNRNEFLYIP